MPTEDRSNWGDDRLKQDYVLWRNVTGNGRALEGEQLKRYEATCKEIEKRNRALANEGKRPIIVIER